MFFSRFWTLLFLVFWSVCSHAWAETQAISSPAEIIAGKSERQVNSTKDLLTQLSRELAKPSLEPDRLSDIKNTLEKTRIEAVLGSQAVGDGISDLRRQIEKFSTLTTSPVKPTQNDPLLQEKARLNGLLARMEAAKTGLDLLAGNSEQLASQVATLQRDDFFRRVFEPSRSVLHPLLWTEAIAELPTMAGRLLNLVYGWSRDQTHSPFFLFISGLLLFGILASVFFLWQRILKAPLVHEPLDVHRRLWFSVRAIFGSAFFLGIGLFIFQSFLFALGVTSLRTVRLVSALTEGVGLMFFVRAFARAVFRPRSPSLRLVDMSHEQASKIAFFLTVGGIIIGIGRIFSELTSVLYLPVALSVGWASCSTFVMMLCLTGSLLTLRSPTQGESGRLDLFSWWSHFTLLIWGLLFVTGISLILGYIALGEFISTQIFETALLVSTLYMLHHLADGCVAVSFGDEGAFSHFLKTFFNIKDHALRRLAVLLSTVVDILIVIVGIPLLLAHWSLTWIDYSGWIAAFLEGFKIGNLTISPAHFLLGILIFGVGIFGAKTLTFWLDRRVLSRLEIDLGIRNSLQMTTHYALLCGAALFSISSIGFDLSKLALVAGALGVGIGFGLQSIVNNFVSGLILLAERPVKVGDWIVVGAGEGIVKKINVRSTTIETFDRASVIMPNSSLISEALVNKTHTNRVGRATVHLSVAQDVSPEEVKSILLDLATEHPRALAFPEPVVIFSNFTPGMFDFVLHLFVSDVTQAGRVESEMRFSIHRVFSEKGISFASAPLSQGTVPPSVSPDSRGKRSYFSVRRTAQR